MPSQCIIRYNLVLSRQKRNKYVTMRNYFNFVRLSELIFLLVLFICICRESHQTPAAAPILYRVVFDLQCLISKVKLHSYKDFFKMLMFITLQHTSITHSLFLYFLEINTSLMYPTRTKMYDHWKLWVLLLSDPIANYLHHVILKICLKNFQK